jgi:hypothetical protein
VHEVEAGDPAVDDAVLHVFRNVCGANEEDVDRCVPTRERERAVAGALRTEAGVMQ